VGKKPAERATAPVGARNTSGLDAAVPCGSCGAPSRRSHKQFRVCANGHIFTKKSDQH